MCIRDSHTLERALDRRRAVGAGHAGDRQVRRRLGHAIAHALDTVHQLDRLDHRGIVDDLGALVGEIDIRLDHALLALQRTSDRIGAVGAGHSGDGDA